MTDTNVFQLSQPGTFADPVTDVLRSRARALLTQAVEAKVAALRATVNRFQAAGLSWPLPEELHFGP